MKCSELKRILERDGWYMVSRKGSHIKLAHPFKKGVLVFPDHGNREVGKGLVKKLLKDAGIRKRP